MEEFLNNLAKDDTEMEEEEKNKKAEQILEIGRKFKEEGKAIEMVRLIKGIEAFTLRLRKPEATRLTRELVDLHLDTLAALAEEQDTFDDLLATAAVMASMVAQ